MADAVVSDAADLRRLAATAATSVPGSTASADAYHALGEALESRSTLLEQDIRTTGGQFGGMPLQSRAAHLHSEFDGTAQPLARACDAIRLPPDPLSGQQSQPCRPVVELLAKFVRVRQEVHDRLGRRGRPAIRDQFDDGRVRLVPDGRDHGEAAAMHCIGHPAFVEGLQILGGTTPSGDEDRIHTEFTPSRIDATDGLRHLRDGIVALHPHIHDQ